MTLLNQRYFLNTLAFILIVSAAIFHLVVSVQIITGFQRIVPVSNEELHKNWALYVTQHQKSIRSQGGQDGSIEWIFNNIGTTNRFYVEFGFSNDRMEGGTGPNTYYLYEQNWTGLLLDGTYENANINLTKLWVTPESIVDDLVALGVKNNTDFISVDIDSADCFVFKEIACKLMPRVVSNLTFSLLLTYQ